MASDDEELIATTDTALGEAEIALALDGEDAEDSPDLGMSQPSFPSSDGIDAARDHLQSALQRARHIESKDLILRLTTALSLIAELDGDAGTRDTMAKSWMDQSQGDVEYLAVEKEQAKQVARIIRMVGCRVSEGWR